MRPSDLTEQHLTLTCPQCAGRFRHFAVSDRSVSCPLCSATIAEFDMSTFTEERAWWRYWFVRERRREIMARIKPYYQSLPAEFPIALACDGTHLSLAYEVWGAAHPDEDEDE